MVTSASATAVGAAATFGTLNYLAPSVESSLYRNGKVLLRRDRDGSDTGMEGMTTAEVELVINDARSVGEAQRRTIETHGFELLARPLARPGLDFYDNQQIVREYYAECAGIVQEATGAAHVFAFDHNIRSAAGKKSNKRVAGGQAVQHPVYIVHGDYTLTSGPQRLRDLANPPGANDTLRTVLDEGASLLDPGMVERALGESGRFAVINLWRNIAHEPVASHPLALCDGQTVNPEDLVVFEIHYHDRIGENYFAKPAPQHGWYYYPAMTRGEALLIKQWDSAGELARSGGARADSSTGGACAPCSFSFHTAFKDATIPPDAPDRESIEVRCIVLYD